MLKKIASNTAAQIMSKVGTAIISIFLISILTNYLTIDLYGLYLKIYNYIGIFVFLADLGLYTIAIREISAHPNDTKKIVGNVMTLRTILALLIFGSALVIAQFLPGYDSQIALWGIGIICVFTLFQLINSSVLTLMQAKMKMEFSLFSSIIGKLVNLGAVAAIAYMFFVNTGDNFDYYYPFLWIIWASVLGIFVNTLMNYLYAMRIQKFGFAFDWDYIKHIVKISLPYGIALFLSVVYFKVDVILLSLLEPTEFANESVALYSLPMRIVEVVMVLGGFYLNSVLPSLTNYFKEKKSEKFSQLVQISFKILFSSGLLIFIMGVLFRENMIEIIANKDYLDSALRFNSADAFLVVFAVVLFHFISLVFIYTLIASNNQSKLLKINIFVTLFNIIGNIILIPYLSFIGAGIVTLLSQIILMILGYFYSRNIIDFQFPWKDIIKNIFIALGIYFLGRCIIEYFSIGLYADVIIYGGILFCIYGGILFFNYKNILEKRPKS